MEIVPALTQLPGVTSERALDVGHPRAVGLRVLPVVGDALAQALPLDRKGLVDEPLHLQLGVLQVALVRTLVPHADAHLEEADGVVVDTGAGDDGSPTLESPITVQDATITNGLTLVTGAGNDIASVARVTARDMLINTGIGNDFADLVDLIVRNDLSVLLSAGNDRLDIAGGPRSNRPHKS